MEFANDYCAPGVAEVIVIIFVVTLILAIAAVKVLVYCMVFHKAGYSWAFGLLMLVPIANIIMPFILAFGDWPIRKELRQLQKQQNNTSG